MLFKLGPAIVALVVWVLTLMTLAILTANPTTLNIAQITAAPLVIEATLDPGDPATWRVSRSWPSSVSDETARIQGLDKLRIDPFQPYLIPVERVGAGEYRLVLSPKPFATPFIYSADPGTIADLEALLRQHEAE